MNRLCQEKTPDLTRNGSSVIGIDLGLAGEHQRLLLKKDRTLAAIWLLVILNFRIILLKVINFDDVYVIVAC